MADDREVFARARRMISALCAGDQPWEMNVPARPDEDSDLVLAAAVTLGESLLAERDAIAAEVARLREALLWTTAMFRHPGENSLEGFERQAALFFRETGYLRPGKDCPIHDHDTRQAAWEEWVAGKLAATRALVEAPR